jgi:putative GTP pyrophosphokinase
MRNQKGFGRVADLGHPLGVDEEKDDIALNTESLRRVLDMTLPDRNRDETEPEDYRCLLDELRHFKISTTRQLESLIKKHLKAVLEDEKRHVQQILEEVASGEKPRGAERARHGVYFTHVGLTRGALSHEFPREFRKYYETKISD